MSCAIYGNYEELDTHILLECPMAEGIWEASLVDHGFWGASFGPCVIVLSRQGSLCRQMSWGIF